MSRSALQEGNVAVGCVVCVCVCVCSESICMCTRNFHNLHIYISPFHSNNTCTGMYKAMYMGVYMIIIFSTT